MVILLSLYSVSTESDCTGFKIILNKSYYKIMMAFLSFTFTFYHRSFIQNLDAPSFIKCLFQLKKTIASLLSNKQDI